MHRKLCCRPPHLRRAPLMLSSDRLEQWLRSRLCRLGAQMTALERLWHQLRLRHRSGEAGGSWMVTLATHTLLARSSWRTPCVFVCRDLHPQCARTITMAVSRGRDIPTRAVGCLPMPTTWLDEHSVGSSVLCCNCWLQDFGQREWQEREPDPPC